MIDKRALAEFAGTYLTSHPDEMVRALKNVALFRFGLPLELLRWTTGQIRSRKAPKDVQIDALPPGIRLAATVDLMKTPIRAGATLFFDHVSLTPRELLFEVRLRDVSLDLMGESDSPVAALLKSGALDLSRPATLAANMPKRSPALVEASDDRLLIDLMRDPMLAKRAARLASLVTPIVSIRSIETDVDHLDFYFRWFPSGVPAALGALRRVL